MKKLLKKMIAVGLAGIMLLSMVACGGDGEEAQPTNPDGGVALKETTLKLTLPGDVTPQSQEAVLDAVEAKMKADGLNIQLEITYLPWGEYWNRVSMIAAAQEDYDILWIHSSTIAGLAATDALAPLNDALEAFGSELTANVPDYYWQGGTINGNIYGIPRTAPVAAGEQLLYIRQDLLDKYGMEVPDTYEEVAAYYEAVHTNEPGMKVIDQDHSQWMLREFGQIYFPLGSFSKWPVYIDVSADEMVVKSWYESEYFKTICQRNRSFYNSGYRHAERGTVADADSYFYNNQLAAVWSSQLKPTERVDAQYSINPDIQGANVMINPEKGKYIFNSVDNMLAVYSSSSNVYESVAFINWLRSSQENFDLFTYGIEGVNYKLVGDQISYDGISKENMYSVPFFAWTDNRFTRYSDKLDPAYVEALKTWDDDATISPLNGFIVDTTPFQVKYAQLQAVEGEFVEDLTYGVTDYDQVYDEFIGKLKKAGLDLIISEIQKQVDDFVAAQQ